MAAVKGVNATKAADPSPSNILNPGTLGGKVRVMVDSYEAAALALASTITIGKALPAGAIIVGVAISTDALGAGVTCSVGDSASANRYVDALVCTAATANNAVLTNGLGYVIGTAAGDDTIIVTTGVGAATGTINVVISYVVE